MRICAVALIWTAARLGYRYAHTPTWQEIWNQLAKEPKR